MNMNELVQTATWVYRESCAKWKKPVTQGHILDDAIIWNVQNRLVRLGVATVWARGREEAKLNDHRIPFGETTVFLI